MRCWIAVASADHVALGRRSGFMQVCHGKVAPLRRLSPGDGVVYYAPTTHFGGGEKLQSFVALGTVAEGAPFQVEMTPAFLPWRRHVIWREATPAPIHPLLGDLSFTRDRRNWGASFRFGLFACPPEDFDRITAAMSAPPPAGLAPDGHRLRVHALPDRGRSEVKDCFIRAE